MSNGSVKNEQIMQLETEMSILLELLQASTKCVIRLHLHSRYIDANDRSALEMQLKHPIGVKDLSSYCESQSG